MIDFSVPSDLANKGKRIQSWVQDVVIPYETDSRLTAHGPNDELRQELIELAREADLLTIQRSARWGGEGLSHVETAVLFEAAGWSTLGPVAMNCAAPDEGNMALLDKVATASQAEQYLRPVVEGHARSVFAMTEPDGAGSDPSQLNTTASFDGENFRINGLKWLITGAFGARTWIIMAYLSDGPNGAEGPTLFLADGNSEGIILERQMDSMDRNYVQGHGVVRFDDLRLPRESVLGEPGEALKYAQLRLVPARMTHAMRWLGAASRAQRIATDHAMKRTAFGSALMEHQGVSFMLAENEIALRECRLSIWHTCWLLDQGEKARHESSITKAFTSEELFKVADRCVQVLGGIGVTDETVVAMIFRDIRGFRLYDGPTEVHKYAIARKLARKAEARAKSH